MFRIITSKQYDKLKQVERESIRLVQALDQGNNEQRALAKSKLTRLLFKR